MGDDDKEEGRISDGKFVMVQRGDNHRIILFQSHETIAFGRGPLQQNVLLKNALGKEYYSAFRLAPTSAPPKSSKSTEEAVDIEEEPLLDKKGKPLKPKPKFPKKYFSLEKIDEPASKSYSLQFEPELPEESPSTGRKDNRNIFDDSSSQPLKQYDIHNLKDQGLSSKEILSTIVSSSKSFAQKTEFSQEKYLKKKEKVHADIIIFLKMDFPLLMDHFFKRDPQKLLGLRPDTISQLLSYANIHAGGRYLVYENANGMVVAGILQRMGGLGLLLHCHPGTNPQKQSIQLMNFSEESLKPLTSLDIFCLIKGRSDFTSTNGSTKSVTASCEDVEDEPSVKKTKLMQDDDDSNENDMQMDLDVDDSVNDDKQKEERQEKPPSNWKIQNEISLKLLETPFGSLVICGKEHPLSIFQRLLPHLKLSSPFVIFSAYPEPLMDCYCWVKEKNVGINMHIVDNWLRNIQVETERTHPEINMSSSGGYILYGIYVNDS